MAEHASILVIGLGNPFRGDDAAGLLVAETIQTLHFPGVRVVAGVSDGASLVVLWKEVASCYVVDCTVSGAPVGTIRRYDVPKDSIPERLFSSFSTHAFSVTQAVALARQLGRLPERLVVFGIEGYCFETGRPPSPEVTQGVEAVVQQISADVSRVGRESAVSLPHKKTARR